MKKLPCYSTIVLLLLSAIHLLAQVPDVPYFYQYNNSINPGGSCQNTSMAMLLKYYGAASITPDAISTTWGTSQAQTVSGFNQVCNDEAQSYGLTGSCVSTSSGSFAAMNSLLAQGKPVVVHGYFTTYGHVMVVLAYTGTEYICNDPAGQWTEVYQGGYTGSSSTIGDHIYYDDAAFQDAIGPDNTLWYHYFNGTPPGDPTNLTATQSACPLNNVTFSWTNAGSGWHIDISTSSSFTNYWWKYVSNLTTYTGPTGFVDHVDGVTPLVFQPGTTYYWRITTSSGSFSGTPFTIHTCDTIAPTTSVSIPTPWVTADFTATFTDTDNSGGSGIEKGYYQAADYNGTSWRANDAQGYFTDDFSFFDNSLWTVASSGGSWNVTSGALVQTDESLGNTNIYTPLTQNLSNRYIYHFTAKAEGSGTDRRFGFHYFCDNATQTNRGNSYFVWFRIEGQTLEFFKVVNNSFTAAQKIVNNVVTVPGQVYDYKIIYDRITGKTDVYRDNVMLGTWTDTSPLASGSAISFRTGNAKLTINEFNVYRSRAATKSITVGTSASDIRYQNPSPTEPAARIKSLAADSAGNLSPVVTQNMNVDWSQPANFTVNDGTGSDIFITSSLTTLSANWTPSSDMQSGIAKYSYAIGTFTGLNDVVDWTDAGLDTLVTVTGLSLTHGQTYFFTVRAQNTAGLFTAWSSDGVEVDVFTTTPLAGADNQPVIFYNAVNQAVIIKGAPSGATLHIYDITGRLWLSFPLEHENTEKSVASLPAGIYTLIISGTESFFVQKMITY